MNHWPYSLTGFAELQHVFWNWLSELSPIYRLIPLRYKTPKQQLVVLILMLTQPSCRTVELQAFDLSMLENLRQQAQNYLGSLLSQEKIAEFDRILKAKIQIEKQMVQHDQRSVGKGRGGNNIAQNLKKSFLSLLKRKLPANLYQEFHIRFIKPYNIKSQKENLVIFFLFLQILFHEKKVERRLIIELIHAIKEKIEKYIYNSTLREESQEWRREFHQKNRVEFTKFLKLDLDFQGQRDLEGVLKQIGTFYLRKKMEISKAQAKIRAIIAQFPCLSNIFYNVQKSEQQLTEQSQEKTIPKSENSEMES